MKFVPVCLVIILIFLISGCTHIRFMNENTSHEELAQTNTELSNRSGSMTLKDGNLFRARGFEFRSDSLMMYVHRNESPRAFPNSDIDHVVIPDRKKGLVEGLEYGAIEGGIVGGALGLFLGLVSQNWRERTYAPGDSLTPGVWRSSPSHHVTPLEGLAYGALIGAVSGSALGVFIGGTGGSLMEVRFRYKIPKAK